MMRRIVCLFALPLLAIHGISQMAEAFWVGSKSGEQFPIHEEITHDALRYVKFGDFEIALGNGKTEHFYPGARLQIAQFNRDADDDQTPSNHFDNDLFTESSERLKDLRFHILQDLKREEFQQFTPSASVVQLELIRKAHKNMGEALHTLQDFYSHSNWVERNGRDQKNLLSTFGKGIVSGGYTPSTCNVFDFETSPLTTGWAWKNEQGDLPADLVGLQACFGPTNKCPHGFVLPCPGLIPFPGMNKDYPLRPGHEDARYLATQATAHFVRNMLQELLLNPPNTASPVLSKSAAIWAVCQFMGVPNAFSKCLTSHTVTVQKLNTANGQPTLGGLVQSSGENITPAIDCGFLCEGTAIAGSTVVLTAKNSGNWRFVRWSESGVCPGSTNSQCNVTVDGDKLAKAEFTDLQFVDWTSIDINNRIVSGTLGSTTVTFSWTADGSIGATWFDEDLSWFSDPAFTPSVGSMDGLEFSGRKLPEPTPTYTITFSAPVTNPLLHIASNASTLTFIGSTPTRISGDERLSVNGNQVIGSDYNSPNGTDANGTVMFSGFFSSLTFTAQYSGSGPGDGITLQVGTP